MRRKLVLWGTNEKDEKMLVALELLENENVVNIFTFPEKIATEDFYKKMSENWKNDQEVEFPDGFQKIERKLSVSDSLLPDEIRVERPDLITRAQAEWHFVVLSSKLYGLYKSEIEDFKDKIESLSEYDNKIWEELKNFWSKVQNQVNDRNLFREHAASLRERTNGLFDKLKSLKKVLESEYETRSKSALETFSKELNDIEQKVEQGLGLNPLFEDLKKLQQKIKNIQFTKDDRNEMWDKIDAAFKSIKEKRGNQNEAHAQHAASRIQKRYDGLVGAVQKMQKSIQIDQRELDFQNKKVEDSDGQLESQLRKAKIRMIEERISSKQEKLDDMLKTKVDLESKLEKEKKKMAKLEKQEKIEEAKEIVKQKIADNISETQKEMDKISDKLTMAAENIKSQKKPKSKAKAMIEQISESAENLVEDVVDSVKAVIEVAEDKIEDLVDKVEDIFDKEEE
jgi:chromosome segregation ATPase